MFNQNLNIIPAGQASSFINLVPVFTIILGWMILGESFTPLQFLGVVLVFSGVIITQLSRHTKKGSLEKPTPGRH